MPTTQDKTKKANLDEQTQQEPPDEPLIELPLLEIIKSALEENKVPKRLHPLFLALAHLESGFTHDAISRVGAVGLYQLIPVTASYAIRSRGKLLPADAKLYNPIYRKKKRVLHGGVNRRYSPRILGLYAGHLKRLKRKKRRTFWKQDRPAYLEAMRKADIRFDPFYNALLGIGYLKAIKNTYFGRYRCYIYRGRNRRHRGKRVCGRFSGVHATFLAVAAYHMGMGHVENLIAASQSRSLSAYLSAARRSHSIGHRRNYHYLARLLMLYRRYRRVYRRPGKLNQRTLARIFRKEPIAVRNLFRRYQLTKTTDVL